MIKIVLPFLAMLLLCSPAFADPFYTSSPYPKGEEQGGDVGVPNQPFEFVVTLDSVPQVSPAITEPDGKVRMWFDVQGVGVGPHTIKAAARNAAGPSADSAVLTFTKSCTATVCKYVFTTTEGATKKTVTVTVPIVGQYLGLKGKIPLIVDYPEIVQPEE
jgi:hypothetical protein